MIRFLLGLLVFFCFYLASCSHTKKTALIVSPIGIAFNSICCGPPSADFLKTFLIQYNDEHSTKTTADIASGCGREGEFVIFINSKSVHLKQDLLIRLSDLVEKENKKNKQSNPSVGNISVIGDTSKIDYEFCRISLQRWLG